MAAIMSNTIALMEDVRAQVNQFVQSNNGMNEYFNTIFKHLQEQVAKNDELESDLKAEKKFRTVYQQEAEQFQRDAIKYKRENEELSTKNHFVVVLVDGDGAKFCDNLLNYPDPMVGAQEAAGNLKKAVREYLLQEGLSEDVTIIVRVFAHVAGLAKALTESKVIPGMDRMFSFAEKFTNSCAELDFVNVGRGKENADSKIRRNLAHYYNINQCKKVFLAGCCHDGGYAHEIRLYNDPGKKIVLVETTPAEPDYKTLAVPMIKFDAVFRSEPLNNETKRGPAKATRTSPTMSKAVPESSLLEKSPPATDAATSRPPLAPTSDSQRSVKSENGGKRSFSKVAGDQNPGNFNLKLTKPKEQANKFYYTNKSGCRVDRPLDRPSPFDSPAQVSYREKVEAAKAEGKRGLCNRHYLQKHCDQGQWCHSDHETELNREELAILRFIARKKACNNGQDCVDPTCPFSHHCTFGEGCTKRFIGQCGHSLHLTEDQKTPFYKKYIGGKVERV